MKKVTTDDSLPYVGLLKNVLEQSGIACVIKNDQLSGGLGEIPFLECLPELWVLEDQDLARATTLLTILEEPQVFTPPSRPDAFASAMHALCRAFCLSSLAHTQYR